jgi:hypothetical protein
MGITSEPNNYSDDITSTPLRDPKSFADAVFGKSKHYDAAAPQPTPVGDGIDVAVVAAERLKALGLYEIAEDIEARIRLGERKYGTRLKAFNGRDAAMDAYQEILDFLNYSMQGVVEGREGCQDLFDRGVSLAVDVQGIMNGKGTNL